MPLRNPNINYSKGWFFVTSQVAMNKSIFGLIADGKCVLNDLGKRVEAAWCHLAKIYPDVYFDKFVLMPNHFHAIVKVGVGTEAHPHESRCAEAPAHESRGAEAPTHESRGAEAGAGIVGPRPPCRGLSRVVHSFKSFTANKIYRPMVQEGLCPDIGASLWQASYYDNLITNKQQLDNIRRYVEQNPARWDRDRFGPVTTYHLGNLELLRGRLVAPVISTFTSPREREVMRECLAAKRPLVWVRPGGLPTTIYGDLQAAIDEGRALLLSPVPEGTGVNKQRAIWCNRYVIDQATEITHGPISRGGMLETLLKAKGILK